MFGDAALQSLLDYAGNGPVLSVYLNADAMENRTEAVKIALKNLLKKADLPEDEAAVSRFVELEWDWSGRGLAIFSSQADGYFRAWPLALPVPNRLFVAPRPYIKPLANLVDNYGYYGVALVDKQGARFFFFHLGELVEQEGVLGEDIRQGRQSGTAAAGRRGGGDDRTREQINRNLKEAAEFADRFFAEKKVRKIVLAGTDENVAEFRALLPKRWQSLVVGHINVNMSAGFNDLRARVLELGEAAERQQEARLVEQVFTLAAKGENGVLGLDETLSAVHEGRVQTLVVYEGYEAGGWRCEGCQYLTTQTLETCPFCGGTFEPIADAVELAVRRVLDDGGEVDVVRDNPDLAQVGIGGLLRY